MKSNATLAKVVLAAIILISFSGSAVARNMTHEVMEPAAIGDSPIDSDPMRVSLMWDAFPQPPQFDGTRRMPVQDFDFHPALDNATTNRMPVQDFDFHPALDNVINNRMPVQDFDFYPALDNATSNRMPVQAVPEPIQAEVMGKYPYEDIGFHPTDHMGKNPVDAVRQPEQCDPIRKNPVDAVRQPEQCDPIRKNPVEAVKQPDQCVDPCFRMPTQAVREPLCVEFEGPTMRLTLKNDAATEIAIYSVNGRLIRRLSAQLSSGENELTWDGRTNSGARAASGVYFAQVQAGTDVGKGKLVLVR